jgi:hypothetical protein
MILRVQKDRLAATRAGGGEAQPSREPQFTLALPLHDRNGADRIRW